MELKLLNKLVLFLLLVINIGGYSQMKMADIENKKFSFNLKTEKMNIIKIYEDKDYDIFYIVDRKRFNFDKRLTNVDLVNLIFFSKKYNKGILTLFKQSIKHKKKSIYNISLYTEAAGNYMFIPSMIIVDRDFKYEYLMKYHYMMPPPPEEGDYSSWITIEDIKNHCNFKDITLRGNAIYEDINDILSNISKMSINENKSRECNPLISDEDLKHFFPERIDKNGPFYYKK